ncbi:MAG: hypothetical protein QOF35_476 [Actinomycetota bacterium]|jgi:DNA-binding transcriptional regulator LsrR (DeoR family)|nr:hypothetical protein [Actinomycetota bacterium]
MSATTPADIVQALHHFGLERDRFRTALTQALGIPMADLDALEHLELAGGLTQRELGERLLLTSGAVTMLVDRLERDGLVNRRPHPTDRRKTIVELAPHSALPPVPALDAYHAASSQAATALPAAGRQQVAALLKEITQCAAAGTEAIRASRGTPAGPSSA